MALYWRRLRRSWGWVALGEAAEDWKVLLQASEDSFFPWSLVYFVLQILLYNPGWPPHNVLVAENDLELPTLLFISQLLGLQTFTTTANFHLLLSCFL